MKSIFFKIVLFLRAISRCLRWCYYKAILGHLGKASSIQPGTFIEFPYNVFIGERSTVNEGVIIQATHHSQVHIGNRVCISYQAIILTAALSLKDSGYRGQHEYKSIVIEDDAWIAACAVILPGVTVGARSAVAAGAVVTHDVPPDTIVAGVPAKVVKKANEQTNQQTI